MLPKFRGRGMLALVVSMCLLTAQASAETNLGRRWNELAPLITGKRVWLRLNGGVRIAGTVREVDSLGLKVDITKTSNRKAYPRGLASIPRSEVPTIQLNKPAGHKGLIIGGAVGVGFGATMGGLTVAGSDEGPYANPTFIAALASGLAAVGLLLGALGDSIAHHGGKRIIVLPD
jgi:hypothetical protein